MRAAAATAAAAGETACEPRAGGERAREHESYTQHIKKDSRNRERELEGEREREIEREIMRKRERESKTTSDRASGT